MALSVAQKCALEFFAEQDGPTANTRVKGRTIQSLWALGLLEPVKGYGNLITSKGLAAIAPTWNVTGTLMFDGGPCGRQREFVDRFVVAPSADAAIALVNAEALRDHKLFLSARATRRREIAGVPVRLCAACGEYKDECVCGTDAAPTWKPCTQCAGITTEFHSGLSCRAIETRSTRLASGEPVSQ